MVKWKIGSTSNVQRSFLRKEKPKVLLQFHKKKNNTKAPLYKNVQLDLSMKLKEILFYAGNQFRFRYQQLVSHAIISNVLKFNVFN